MRSFGARYAVFDRSNSATPWHEPLSHCYCIIFLRIDRVSSLFNSPLREIRPSDRQSTITKRFNRFDQLKTSTTAEHTCHLSFPFVHNTVHRSSQRLPSIQPRSGISFLINRVSNLFSCFILPVVNRFSYLYIIYLYVLCSVDIKYPSHMLTIHSIAYHTLKHIIDYNHLLTYFFLF